MRDTVGYRPRRRRKPRPCDSFAYAGGDIRHLTSFPDPHRPIGPIPVLPPPVADPVSLPPLDEVEASDPGEPKAAAFPDQPPVPQPIRKELDPVMDTPSQAHESSAPQTVEPFPVQPEPDMRDPSMEELVLAASEAAEPVATLRPAPPIRAPRSPQQNPNHPPAKAEDINLSRHAARCTICRHPQRDAIEQAFLHWWRPTDLAAHFKLGHRLAVYRHAHAFGLFERRKARTQHALGYIIEQAESVAATAESVIRAVKILGCLDENGRWIEPRKEVIITHRLIDTRVEQKRGLSQSESAI